MARLFVWRDAPLTTPRWFGLQGPLCPACYDRLQREERVRLHHTVKPAGVRGWIKDIFRR